MANLERGFRRLTWVVSVVRGIPCVGLGVYGLTEKDTAFASALILIGTGAFVLSWIAFFILRWVAVGLRDSKRRARDSPDDDDSDLEEEEEESEIWWRRLLRPIARLFVFSYFGRPHCRYPAIHKDSWGNHPRRVRCAAYRYYRREGPSGRNESVEGWRRDCGRFYRVSSVPLWTRAVSFPCTTGIGTSCTGKSNGCSTG
jgi:hypothetical protein